MRGKLNIKVASKTPFYFVSYNSEDARRVTPCAKYLVSNGIPLWCDNGIPYGEKWDNLIAEKIKKCNSVLLFFTNGCLMKKESFVRKEYEIAKYYKKQVIVIFLDEASDVKIPTWSISWFVDLKRMQNIHQSAFENQKEMLHSLLERIAEPKKVEEVKAVPSASPALLSCFVGRVEKPAGETETKLSKETLIACLPPRYLVPVDIVESIPGYQAIRHLAIPLGNNDAKAVLKRLNERFHNRVRMLPGKKRKSYWFELPRTKIPAISFKPLCSHLFSYENGLYLPVGYGFGGEASYTNLTTYGHFFVIGDEGCGKSYYLRTLALAALLQAPRCRVRLHIYDATKSKIFREFKDTGDGQIFQLAKNEDVDQSFDVLRKKIKDIGAMKPRDYKRSVHIQDIIIIDDYEAFLKTFRGLGKKYLKLLPDGKDSDIHFIIASRFIKGSHIKKNIEKNGRAIFSIAPSLAAKLSIDTLLPLLQSHDFLGKFPDLKECDNARFVPAYVSDDEVLNCLRIILKK